MVNACGWPVVVGSADRVGVGAAAAGCEEGDATETGETTEIGEIDENEGAKRAEAGLAPSEAVESIELFELGYGFSLLLSDRIRRKKILLDES